MRGRVDIEVAATVPSLDELLAEPERPTDAGEDTRTDAPQGLK